MSNVADGLALTKGVLPPLPLQDLKEIVRLTADVERDEFDDLIDLVIRLRADCIVLAFDATQGAIQRRQEYRAVLEELVEQWRLKFEEPFFGPEARGFFNMFRLAVAEV